MERHKISHDIAVQAATQMVKQGINAGLDYKDIAISCETVIAIVVSACVDMTQSRNPITFATEMMNLMTERAQERIVARLKAKSDTNGY